MHSHTGLLAAATMLLVQTATGQPARPLREASSTNGTYVLRVEPGRPGSNARPCEATLLKRAERGERGRPVWQRALVNDVGPMQAFVRDDGRYVITLDEYRRGGARHALVIYGAQGELLRHFLLPDLLVRGDWEHIKSDRRVIAWLDGADCRFATERDEFVVRLKWGREIHIDLKLLEIVEADGRPARLLAAVPLEWLATLFATEDEGDSVIAERLAELAQLSPEEQARAAEIADALQPEDPTTTAPAAVTDEALAAALPTEGEPPITPLTEGEVPPETPAVADDASAVLAEAAEPLAPPTAEEWAAGHEFAGMTIPPPDPIAKTDYVAWLNSMGHVEGPDGAPLYDAAMAQFQRWPAEDNTDRLAAEGDPAALQSPEYRAWLEQNADALAAFREGSRYPARSWQRHSETGDMLGVLLPDLSLMRNMGRAVVAEGRLRAAESRPLEAAECYLDALAAGKHVGDAYTLIEDLVGIAMQTPAAEAVLDLAASPEADEVDFTDFAAQLETAYQPARSPAQSIQGERAFYMDTVQRLWDVDPQTGECVPNPENARAFAEIAGDPSDNVTLETLAAELSQTSFEDTVAAGNEFYDTLTQAMSEPYAEAIQHMQAIEERMTNEQGNPVVRRLAPALSRYHFIKTRGETTRRATLLVANLQAYRQQHGEFPPSLDVFAEREFAYDPFAGGHFAYRREGDSFVLYSTGGNVIDNGGTHDAKGEQGDIVYWPRPR